MPMGMPMGMGLNSMQMGGGGGGLMGGSAHAAHVAAGLYNPNQGLTLEEKLRLLKQVQQVRAQPASNCFSGRRLVAAVI